ncbi:ATP-binding cassette domain-containing protein [Mollicutes bacterium LVI A0039]|nr:ATP-binding cassette domain-containing protein [Mollicutes bacterium LVI A0039]
MLSVNNLSVVYSTKKLFENVSLKFTPGNCYGVIGANGAGKSTFLKILSKEYDSTTGDVQVSKDTRISTLKQDHYEFDEFTVMQAVISGYEELYTIMSTKDALYAKADFTEADGIKAAELEEEFATLGGWEAETEVSKLLDGLSLESNDYHALMTDVSASDKVKILLARALFGSPDVLILDEPTNHLDFKAIKWLEDFIIDFDKTVIVVSHDRHFLNNVCTHIVDIDFQKAKLYVGNYDFWRESSQLAQELMSKSNQQKEEKVKQLQEFIARFSANASKSKQATSRKKMLEKITLDDISPSSRQYPYIQLDPERELGKDVVDVTNLCVHDNEGVLFENVNFIVNGGEKVAFISRDDKLITELFEVLAGEKEQASGEVKWGITVERDYFPKDYSEFFQDEKINLIDWLREYSKEQADAYIRGFLGKMLFSKEEPLKKVKILSGGEKMRMMFTRLMVRNRNTLILDQPTNHLDLESIQSVNESLERFKGGLFFSSHDLSLIESIANKIIEITPNGAFVYSGTFEEYSEDVNAQKKVDELYNK